MNVYIRVITKREPMNRFGKLGYVEHTEVLVNPTNEVLSVANYKKHIKFRCFCTDFVGSLDELRTALTEYGFQNIDILYYTL